jgi:hypothetical protein
VVAGTLVAAVLVPLGNWLYARTSGPTAPAASPALKEAPRA